MERVFTGMERLVYKKNKEKERGKWARMDERLDKEEVNVRVERRRDIKDRVR